MFHWMTRRQFHIWQMRKIFYQHADANVNPVLVTHLMRAVRGETNNEH